MPTPAPASSPAVVTARGPEDLLALAVHTLGFFPHDSLVLISLRGPRKRSGLVLRVDLEPLTGLRGAARDQAAAALAAPMADDGARAVVALLVSCSAGVRPAHRRLVSALAGALGERGVVVEEATLLDGARLYSLTCRAPCCPRSGRPIGDVAASLVGTEMVALGSAPSTDRTAVVEELLARVSPADDAGERVARAAVAAQLASAGGPGGPGGSRGALSAVDRWFALLDAAGRCGARSPDEAAEKVLDPGSAAALLAALGDVLVRDALVVSVVPGAREDLEGAGPGRLRERLDAALDRLAGATGPPDGDDLAAATALVRRLARLAPDGRRATPLAVLAHWGWWRGSTVEATVMAEAALAADPACSLAALVVQLADAAVPPDWVRARRAASG